MRKLSLNRGLTLLEVVLSVAILSILAASITVAINRYQAKNDLDLGILGAVEALRRAEILSRGSDGSSGWGVKFATGTITIFKGTDFASRDTLFDEVIDISPYISITGIDEAAFSAIGATTSDIGTTTLLHLSISESRAIYINGRGGLEY